MALSPYRCWAAISRGQLATNFRALHDLVGPAVEVVPVVKADAYHHGAVEVSQVLMAEGARWLAVSSVEEGATLRDAGVDARILVMSDFLPAAREALLDYALTPVIHSLDDLRELDRLATRRGLTVPYHLKVDTGMGRLGTTAAPARICEAVLAARSAQFEGLMTHFASSSDYTTLQTEDQVRRFTEVQACIKATGLHPRYLHLSSTVPLAYGRREAWQSMVRPGHALYGYVSPARGEAPERCLQVKPVLTWRAAVLAVKEMPAKSLIGYGGIHRLARDSRVAIVAAGYADGVPHRLSNRGRYLVHGCWAPLLGAVSMDTSTVDVTDCPPVAPGDTVTILGRDGELSQDAQELARLAGTISYAVLCGISPRVRRVYVD